MGSFIRGLPWKIRLPEEGRGVRLDLWAFVVLETEGLALTDLVYAPGVGTVGLSQAAGRLHQRQTLGSLGSKNGLIALEGTSTKYP